MNGEKTNVAVLMGGPSSEHEVSINTGRKILDALDTEKYAATPVFINKEGEWSISMEELKNHKTDVVFIALHGEYGEDGTVQDELQQAGLLFTGSKALASALGMNKHLSLRLMRDDGIEVPEFDIVNRLEWDASYDEVIKSIKKNFQTPMVIKPADRGSSVGTMIVDDESKIEMAIEDSFKYSRHTMVQKFIKGRELTCGILDEGEGKITPLPPIEIIPKGSEFYDYKAKYADGGSDHIIPPPNMSEEEIRKIQDISVKTHKLIGCSGMSRTDMILGEDGIYYVLEINTIPGMTATSLLPQSAAVAGITFTEFLDRLIQAALSQK